MIILMEDVPNRLNTPELREVRLLSLNKFKNHKAKMGETKKLQSTFNRNYMHASTWRKIFLLTDNQVFHAKTKVIYDRNSTIPKAFLGSKVHIYSGCRFHIRYVTRWMIGFKFGEFSWTRKLALYKAKQLRKKKKKN